MCGGWLDVVCILFDQDGDVVNHAAVFAFGVAGFGFSDLACLNTRSTF
jgi:hypothetical protein